MRFKKGSTVEVMNKKEATTSWHVAEIVSGNGCSYSVRYDCSSGGGKYMGLEKVSRKVIRPCPPPPQGVQNWAAGDFVEVFDDNSWITATVLKILGRDHFLVRPCGLTEEFNVHKSHIRMRQSWKDNQWVPIGKSSRSSGDVKYTKMANSNYYQALAVQVPLVNPKIDQQGCDYNLPVLNDTGRQESHIISSRILKRASPFCSSLLEACPRKSKKLKAIENENRTRRMVPDQSLDKGHILEACISCFQRSIIHDSGLCCLSLGKSSGTISAFPLLQIRQLVANWNLSEKLVAVVRS